MHVEGWEDILQSPWRDPTDSKPRESRRKALQERSEPGSRRTGKVRSAAESFRIAMSQAAILTGGLEQISHRSWSGAARTVEISNLKSDSPLFEQHAVSIEETEFRIVDVGCFRGHTVQLEDLHVTTCHEVLSCRNPNIKA